MQTIFLAMCVIILGIFHTAEGLTAPLLNIDDSGLAVQGYDPVSYHQGQPQKGRKELYLDFDGASYLFSSKKNRDIFAGNPQKYIPAFGGWCAWAMLDGEKIEVDPERFKIINDTTYLFYNTFFNDTLKRWDELAKTETEPVLVKRAGKQWQLLVTGATGQ